jgi:hypothetical protein
MLLAARAHGCGRAAAETPYEFAVRLAGRLDSPGQQCLQSLTHRYARARYGPADGTSDVEHLAETEARAIIAGLSGENRPHDATRSFDL